jgi:hypothetical protein
MEDKVSILSTKESPDLGDSNLDAGLVKRQFSDAMQTVRQELMSARQAAAALGSTDAVSKTGVRVRLAESPGAGAVDANSAVEAAVAKVLEMVGQMDKLVQANQGLQEEIQLRDAKIERLSAAGTATASSMCEAQLAECQGKLKSANDDKIKCTNELAQTGSSGCVAQTQACENRFDESEKALKDCQGKMAGVSTADCGNEAAELKACQAREETAIGNLDRCNTNQKICEDKALDTIREEEALKAAEKKGMDARDQAIEEMREGQRVAIASVTSKLSEETAKVSESRKVINGLKAVVEVTQGKLVNSTHEVDHLKLVIEGMDEVVKVMKTKSKERASAVVSEEAQSKTSIEHLKSVIDGMDAVVQVSESKITELKQVVKGMEATLVVSEQELADQKTKCNHAGVSSEPEEVSPDFGTP